MLNKYKLLAKMVESGYTQRSLAKRIGISKNTFNSKVNGKGYFDTKQIEDICDVLNITSGMEKSEIFLAHSSHFRDDKKTGKAG